MRQQAGRPTVWETAPPESDLAVALFRAAFIVAFSMAASPSGLERSNAPAWLAASLAMLYNVFLFAIWWRRRRTPAWMRPVAILVDIILITAVAGTYDFLAPRIKDIYYLVIFASGMWYLTRGAVVTGILAMLCYAVAYNLGSGIDLTPSNLAATIYSSGAFFMPFVGYAIGVLFRAYSRDMLRLAEIDREIDLARSLQDRLVPEAPRDIPGWEVSACMARARRVGGDFYDFLTLPDGAHLVALADMAGKSIYGLVHLSLLHSHIHDAAERTGDVGLLASEVARRAYPELRPDSYAAAVFLRLDLDGSGVTFANGGHLPPLAIAGDGNLQELFTGDPIVGVMRHHDYKVGHVEASPGTWIVCYTDGLVEARNPRGQVYGEERLRAVALDGAKRLFHPREMCDLLLSDVAGFSRTEPADDQTVVVLRRTAG